MTSNIELHPQCAEIAPNTPLEEFETWLGLMLECQRDVLWQIGDMALAVERQHPRTFHQAFPEWVSPDLISRCKAVSAAYKPHERNILATWTVHMQNAKRPDRVALVEAAVDAGQTSDENRKNPAPAAQPVATELPESHPTMSGEIKPEESAPEEPVTAAPEPEPEPEPTPARPIQSGLWLLCIDISYYVVRAWSKDGVSTAKNVFDWLMRVIRRLHEKGLTGVVICCDSSSSFRRKLTEGWDQPYKERSKKDPELIEQLILTHDLLDRAGFLCVAIDGMEADDVMASYAKQFGGKVTLMTADKDLRQCLSENVNILRDMRWERNTETNQLMPVYEWITSRSHFVDGITYNGYVAAGIAPENWPHFQALAGDSTDDVGGCPGIGAKGAAELIREHNTVYDVIAACKTGEAAVTERKANALIAFEAVAEVTLQLVTMRTDLPVPMTVSLPPEITNNAST